MSQPTYCHHCADWAVGAHPHKAEEAVARPAPEPAADMADLLRRLEEQLLSAAQCIEDCAEGQHAGINSGIQDVRNVADKLGEVRNQIAQMAQELHTAEAQLRHITAKYEGALKNAVADSQEERDTRPHAFIPQRDPDSDICETCDRLESHVWHEAHRLEAQLREAEATRAPLLALVERLEIALTRISAHDNNRFTLDEDGFPTVRQATPQEIAVEALAIMAALEAGLRG